MSEQRWRTVAVAVIALLLIVSLSFLGVALVLQSQLTSFCHDDQTRSHVLRELLRSDAALQQKVNARSQLSGDFWASLADEQDAGTLRRFLASDARMIGDENGYRLAAASYWRELLATVPATHC